MDRKLNDESLAQLADVAKISVTHEEAVNYAYAINALLEKTADIQQVDTNGVVPLINPLEGMQAAYRKDIVEPSLTQAEALAASASVEAGHFKVPRTIEN